MHQFFLEVPETYRKFLDCFGGVDTPMGRALAPKNQAKFSKYMGEGRSISAAIRAPCTQFFWRFLRHIRTFLDHLRGVDPPVGRVLVPRNQAKLSKYMGSGEVNISASIRAPCTTFFWRFLQHIGTFVDHLGGVDRPMGRAQHPKARPKLSKYMGEQEVSISVTIRAPCNKFFRRS